VLPPPQPASQQSGAASSDDWSRLPVPATVDSNGNVNVTSGAHIEDSANSGIRREPELPQHEEIVPEQSKATPEFTFAEEDPDDDAVRARALRQQISGLARQAALDPGDGMKLSE
jgi:type IV secretion system protein VirD4